MSRLGKASACLVLAATAALAGGCSAHSKTGAARATEHPIVLRLESELGDPQPLDQYAREVARLSHGSVKVIITTDAHRGDPQAERKVFADVKAGRAPLGWVGSRYLDRLGDRRFQPLTAPMLIDSYRLEQHVLTSSLVAPMIASMKQLGVMGLGVLPGPLRRVLGISSDLTRPADFRGKVVAYSDSDLTHRSLAALGADPRPSGPMQPLSGFDGSEQQLNSIFGNQYFRGASSITTNLALWPRPLVLFSNTQVFGRLSAAQRRALTLSATNLVPAFAQYARADDAAGMIGLCNAGVRFTAANLPRFAAAFAPVYARLRRDAASSAAIARIETMKRSSGGESPPRCKPSTGTATSTPAELDGVYRKHLTPAQAHSNVAEDWGTIVRVFDHGRFGISQESPKACTWVVGTYRVHGKNIHFVVAEAGGLAPNNAGGKPGEVVDLQWRLYRGALSLPSPPGQGPVEFGAYRKLSPTPSSRFFSRRCPPPAGWDG